MATIEKLYKDFGVLADAKEKAGEVRTMVAEPEESASIYLKFKAIKFYFYHSNYSETKV